MTTVCLLHGSFGHPAENWIPSVAGSLRAGGMVVHTPSMPTPEFQTYAVWSGILDSYLPAGLGDAIFVTHSSSSSFAIRYIAERRIEARALITVAGFSGFISGDDSFDGINSAVGAQSEADFLEVRKLVPSRISYSSTDDPFLPQKILRAFVDDLDSVQIVIDGAGHFNAGAGYVEFPELIEKINSLAS
jgi:serine hydrolase